MTRRPRIVHVEPLHARAIRPPTKRLKHWYWRAEHHADGQSKTVWTGRASRDEVMARLTALIQDGADHDDQAAEPARHGPPRTVGRLLDAWLAMDVRPNRKESTRNVYESHARRLKRDMAAVPLDRATPRVWAAYRDRTLAGGAGAAPGTVALDLKVMALAWRWGLLQDLKIGPWVKIKVPRGKRRKPYTPPAADLHRVLALVPEGWPRDMVTLQAVTGARVGDVARLRAGDIDPKGWIHFEIGKTDPRSVPVGRDVLRRLAPWIAGKAPGGPLWPVSYEHARRKVNTHLKQAAAQAGVRPFTSHGIRRLAVDLMISSGVPVSDAAEITGHSPAVLLRYYRQPSDRDRIRAVDVSDLGRFGRHNVVQLPHSLPAQNGET